MPIDLLFALVAIAIIAIVFGSRGRREKATAASRKDVLLKAAPVVSGSYDDGMLTGTYGGHRVEASLRTTGRIDAVGAEHSSSNKIEVLLLELHGVSGSSPWGFYTSVSFSGSPRERWCSAITLAGVLGTLLAHLSTVRIDPTIDDRLRAGGMLEALERLVPRDITPPYVVVAFVPDHAAAIEERLRRTDALGGEVARRAREEAARDVNRGGRLRIEVERANQDDPTPERLRQLLDTALAVAEVNATINA